MPLGLQPGSRVSPSLQDADVLGEEDPDGGTYALRGQSAGRPDALIVEMPLTQLADRTAWVSDAGRGPCSGVGRGGATKLICPLSRKPATVQIYVPASPLACSAARAG